MPELEQRATARSRPSSTGRRRPIWPRRCGRASSALRRPLAARSRSRSPCSSSRSRRRSPFRRRAASILRFLGIEGVTVERVDRLPQAAPLGTLGDRATMAAAGGARLPPAATGRAAARRGLSRQGLAGRRGRPALRPGAAAAPGRHRVPDGHLRRGQEVRGPPRRGALRRHRRRAGHLDRRCPRGRARTDAAAALGAEPDLAPPRAHPAARGARHARPRARARAVATLSER